MPHSHLGDETKSHEHGMYVSVYGKVTREQTKNTEVDIACRDAELFYCNTAGMCPLHSLQPDLL